MVKDDILQRFHKLCECIAVVKGQMQNETILPMASNMDTILSIGEDILSG